MKTRIISGIVMGVIVACVLAVGFLWNTAVITVAIALLAAVATYELLHNAVGITIKSCWVVACVFSAVYVIISDYLLFESVNLYFQEKHNFYTPYASSVFQTKILSLVSVIYFLYAVFMILKNHKHFDLAKIASLFALPLPCAFAFSSLGDVINSENGIYYLLLLFNFSSVCDMGAYFSGVTLGKHKLCPAISPKKTVEGAVGGILSSIVVTLILSLCFKKAILLPMLLTVPFCILGMIGDLFASAIKRSVDLKDYGNLIPGHGGILDRLDSILMISPLLSLLMAIGII